jgi:MoaA/NifB/PqqE/SkfB family radical SAM enzyme
MLNAVTYLTRACPRACSYCALRDAVGLGKELTTAQWRQAFSILKEIGVDFNLILGNETWLLGEGLLEIMKQNQVPFALYTTCPEPVFTKYRDLYFSSNVIDNLSCGLDYPRELPEGHPGLSDDSYAKSKKAWEGFEWVKKNYPAIDTQGTITIHSQNYKLLPQIVKDLSALGVFVGVNLIHYNKDGGFDFFPVKEELSDLLFSENDHDSLVAVFKEVLADKGLLQNPAYLRLIIEQPSLLEMKWHCHGNPYGGPTIDSDGSLRVCGYRKGIHTPKFTIFDLPAKLNEWREAVQQDAMECVGCHWTYPIMYHDELAKGSEHAKDVFIRHAGGDVPPEKWSNRKLQK